MGPGEVGDRQSASCALAHWHIAAGDFEAARAMLVTMRRVTRRANSPPSVVSPVCAPAVQAQLAAASGDRGSAAEALARLDSTLLATSNYRDQLVTVGNILAARLHERRGDPRRSLEIVQRRAAFGMFLSTQLREEGRLAALIGDRATAVRAYRHYVALRSGAEPRLKPDMERARRELGQLEK